MRQLTTVVAMVVRCQVDSILVLTKNSAVTGDVDATQRWGHSTVKWDSTVIVG